MKSSAFILFGCLSVLCSCEQAKYAISSGVDGIKNQWNQNADEGFLNLVAYASSSNEPELTDKWLSKICHTENKATALITIAQNESRLKGFVRDEIRSQLVGIVPLIKDVKLGMFARMELAEICIKENRELGLSEVDEIEKDVWGISSAHQRAPMLMRLVKFRAEKGKDIPRLKSTIEQMKRTLDTMFDSYDKLALEQELKQILEANSNLLCR